MGRGGIGHEPYSGTDSTQGERADITPAMLVRAASYGFIRPALPSPAPAPPSGPGWGHEIKHDGYRLMVRKDLADVRLLTRNGRDWTRRFPLILVTAAALQVRSCLIDGEAVACDHDGLAVFERLRRKHDTRDVFLYAFDLLELGAWTSGMSRSRSARRRSPACSKGAG
jgi:ATP-dependent DNA ligase